MERELFQFPYGKNDDQVDSVSQYINWRQERDRGGFFYYPGDGPTGPNDGPRTLEDLLADLPRW